jgi:hypothetical protein
MRIQGCKILFINKNIRTTIDALDRKPKGRRLKKSVFGSPIFSERHNRTVAQNNSLNSPHIKYRKNR